MTTAHTSDNGIQILWQNMRLFLCTIIISISMVKEKDKGMWN